MLLLRSASFHSCESLNLIIQQVLDYTGSTGLPDDSSIFTAEAKAIALYHIRNQPEKQFIIYSDSLSVLRSLKNLDHRIPLIQQFFKKYNYLSAFKEIFLLAPQPH